MFWYALFAGHDLGAEHWAVLASLIETCKWHGVNPEAWLADVLTKLVNGWPNRRDFLPNPVRRVANSSPTPFIASSTKPIWPDNHKHVLRTV